MYDHSMNDISIQEVAIEYAMFAEDNVVSPDRISAHTHVHKL